VAPPFLFFDFGLALLAFFGAGLPFTFLGVGEQEGHRKDFPQPWQVMTTFAFLLAWAFLAATRCVSSSFWTFTATFDSFRLHLEQKRRRWSLILHSWITPHNSQTMLACFAWVDMLSSWLWVILGNSI
jgi:hypothetical protein